EIDDAVAVEIDQAGARRVGRDGWCLPPGDRPAEATARDARHVAVDEAVEPEQVSRAVAVHIGEADWGRGRGKERHIPNGLGPAPGAVAYVRPEASPAPTGDFQQVRQPVAIPVRQLDAAAPAAQRTRRGAVVVVLEARQRAG